MSQTSVATRMTTGLAGTPADMNTVQNGQFGSATSSEASAEISFGTMCIRGASDGLALKPHTSAAAMATGNLLLGIALLSQGFAEPQEVADTDAGGIKPKATFSVGKKGVFWVIPEDNVTPASDVRVRVVTAGNEVAGAFRAAQDSTDCVEITPFAKWLTTATGGNPAQLEIDMTHVALTTADV
jgi:hypothetical protein